MIKKLCMFTVVFCMTFILTSISYSQDICRSVGIIAEKIMIERQNDTDISIMMDYANSFQIWELNKEKNDILKNIFRNIIIDAYSRPFYNSDMFKKDAVRNFKNIIMVECYKTL